MILKLLHSIAAHPWVYDRIQEMFGLEEFYRRLAHVLCPYRNAARILDVGGGTGSLRRFWPEASYVCLDIEMPKLRGFRSKFPDGRALQADATCMPISADSVDVVVCMMVAHHLPDGLLDGALAECARVLKPGGHFILVEPLVRPDRLRSRILWALDRGSYPRREEHIRELLTRHFAAFSWATFAIHHEYLVAVFEPFELV